jgi:hypothetical protein
MRRYQRKRLSIRGTDLALKSINEENGSKPDLSGISPAPTRKVLYY